MELSPINVTGVKRDKSALIIKTILSSPNGITRGELAKRCGVTTMTAGKVVTSMLDSGYSVVQKDFTPSGRFSDYIYPSEKFGFLVFEVGEHSLCAKLYDARENTLFSYSQPRNESIPSEEEEHYFASLIYEHTKDFRAQIFCLNALLCSEKLGSGISPSAAKLSKHGASLEYVSHAHHLGTVVFAGGEDIGDIHIISNGHEVKTKSAPFGTRREITSEKELLEHLSDRLSSLFSVLIPDKVIIDNAGLYTTRKFANSLSEMLCEAHKIEKEELPEIVTIDGISAASRSAIGQLIEIYSERLAPR